jgi:hypothetical protein
MKIPTIPRLAASALTDEEVRPGPFMHWLELNQPVLFDIAKKVDPPTRSMLVMGMAFAIRCLEKTPEPE